MLSTKTLDELAKNVIGMANCQSLEDVEVAQLTHEQPTSNVKVDDVFNGCLDPGVEQAIQRVDFTSEEFDAGFTVKEVNLKLRISGMSVIFILVIIASLLLGTQSAQELLRSLMHR